MQINYRENKLKNTYSQTAALYKALGDETRIRILWLLMDKEICVGELTENFSMTPSAISHQLRELKMAGLVKVRRNGKNMLYSIKNEYIKHMLMDMQDYVRLPQDTLTENGEGSKSIRENMTYRV